MYTRRRIFEADDSPNFTSVDSAGHSTLKGCRFWAPVIHVNPDGQSEAETEYGAGQEDHKEGGDVQQNVLHGGGQKTLQ